MVYEADVCYPGNGGGIYDPGQGRGRKMRVMHHLHTLVGPELGTGCHTDGTAASQMETE